MVFTSLHWQVRTQSVKCIDPTVTSTQISTMTVQSCHISPLKSLIHLSFLLVVKFPCLFEYRSWSSMELMILLCLWSLETPLVRYWVESIATNNPSWCIDKVWSRTWALCCNSSGCRPWSRSDPHFRVIRNNCEFGYLFFWKPDHADEIPLYSSSLEPASSH